MDKAKSNKGKDTRSRSPNRSASKVKAIPKSQQQGPKGKKNAYMYFSSEVREEIKAHLMSKYKDDEKSNGKAVTAEISKRYKALSEKEMKPFEELARLDRERFERQTADWEKKGYWLDDGGEKCYPTKKKLKSASKKKAKKNDKKKVVDSDED